MKRPHSLPPAWSPRQLLSQAQEWLEAWKKGTWAEHAHPVPLEGPFFREIDRCWGLQMPELAALADTPEFNQRSTLILMEDGVELGPPHSLHEIIRQHGGGSYSHWGRLLMFSTSDNSDPNTNGRTYSYRFRPPDEHPLHNVSHWNLRNRFLAALYWLIYVVCLVPPFRRAFRWLWNVLPERMSRMVTPGMKSAGLLSATGLPVNQRERDCSPQALRQDVDHAIRVARQYLSRLPGGGEGLRGKTVMEIGPGINLGSSLILACHGATVFVVDRFLCTWVEEYHSRFYATLLQAMPSAFPGVPTTVLETFLAHRQAPEIQPFAHPLENLRTVPYHSVDLFLSNAVLEHCVDTWAACREMTRVARPGALAFHQVDFRDHRDMDRPLEFLLLDAESFAGEFESRNGECGNRVRAGELEQLFREHQWEVTSFEPNFFAEQSYLKDFIPRFQSANPLLAQRLSGEDLRILCGHFSLRLL